MIMTVLTALASVPATTSTLAAVQQAAGDLIAAAPTPSPKPNLINTTNIVKFISTNVAPILLAALGVIFISRAGKGEMSRVLTSSAIAIVGLAFIAGAGALFIFGENLIDLIFG